MCNAPIGIWLCRSTTQGFAANLRFFQRAGMALVVACWMRRADIEASRCWRSVPASYWQDTRRTTDCRLPGCNYFTARPSSAALPAKNATLWNACWAMASATLRHGVWIITVNDDARIVILYRQGAVVFCLLHGGVIMPLDEV